ncbi:2-C-methyl-D-erythritol 4-phosphate cytidylyltransferase [Paraoerskovia marina]|uniref:2-C-methyl-D-erythritol 4-phosphate cytidylyltransferase n=1 Tax=Paraoerskovia marina TaxID=545619 RepID=UPI0004929715|nr:2-C-methyl-D-erythritol 4-phosphate cytidylyltransferase [Paraoerskovia marina]
MTTLAILTAAGSGSRLGRSIPKALVHLGGTPLVVHAARSLDRSGAVDAIVVTAPADYTEQISRLLDGDPQVDVPVTVVAGGSTRQASVAAGLAAAGEASVVLVHDAARPLAPARLVRRVVDAVQAGHGAVVPGMPLVDTVKRVAAPPLPGSGPRAESVQDTVERSGLRAVQTPQGFSHDLLTRAHAHGAARAEDQDMAASDDAGLVESLGEAVVVVRGDERAMKITTARDLEIADLLLAEDE